MAVGTPRWIGLSRRKSLPSFQVLVEHWSASCTLRHLLTASASSILIRALLLRNKDSALIKEEVMRVAPADTRLGPSIRSFALVRPGEVKVESRWSWQHGKV
jgi:hypothetical protein